MGHCSEGRELVHGEIFISGQADMISNMRTPTHGPPTHPGEMLLEEFLKPLGLTVVEVAKRLRMRSERLQEIINEKRGVTADTALRLERLLGMEAQFWLNLQMGWDLYHA